MIIEWLGHAAFLITTDNNIKIITDPYQSGSYGGAIRYNPIELTADIVTISHSHVDHSYTDSLRGKPKIINSPGKFKIKDIQINAMRSFHDTQKGSARGENLIFSFQIEDKNIVHLGDLGHQLGLDLIKEIGKVDILLIPVGGIFTIGPKEAQILISNLKPTLVIPMHFKTKKLSFDIEPIESFLKITKFPIEEKNISSITIKKDILDTNTKIFVLQHSH